MGDRADLEAELGGPLAATGELAEREITDLLVLFHAAREHETAALREAIEMMIGALPRPVRGITKKIMFGDRLDR
ncbi:hypothetical protein [Nocardia sp. NPDC051570]|uniref:hypothetical protein n=1 Tax=Nocardia sp. NPDC051570 TaxID=3364324 RepID=UPI00378F67E7